MSSKAKRRIIAKCSAAVLLVLLIAFFFPRSRTTKHGTGSMRYARKWKENLATCNSLDDVRKEFNCARWQAYDNDSRASTLKTPIRSGKEIPLLCSMICQMEIGLLWLMLVVTAGREVVPSSHVTAQAELECFSAMFAVNRLPLVKRLRESMRVLRRIA
jgi:hypothetical protein